MAKKELKSVVKHTRKTFWHDVISMAKTDQAIFKIMGWRNKRL
jgi:hypothetical protein